MAAEEDSPLKREEKGAVTRSVGGEDMSDKLVEAAAMTGYWWYRTWKARYLLPLLL